MAAQQKQIEAIAAAEASRGEQLTLLERADFRWWSSDQRHQVDPPILALLLRVIDAASWSSRLGCCMSQASLAERCCVSVRTIGRAIAALVAADLITSDPAAYGSAHVRAHRPNWTSIRDLALRGSFSRSANQSTSLGQPEHFARPTRAVRSASDTVSLGQPEQFARPTMADDSGDSFIPPPDSSANRGRAKEGGGCVKVLDSAPAEASGDAVSWSTVIAEWLPRLATIRDLVRAARDDGESAESFATRLTDAWGTAVANGRRLDRPAGAVAFFMRHSRWPVEGIESLATIRSRRARHAPPTPPEPATRDPTPTEINAAWESLDPADIEAVLATNHFVRERLRRDPSCLSAREFVLGKLTHETPRKEPPS